MFHLSRRNFFISAATATAAFGLDKHMEFIAPAHAQKAPAAVKPFARFKVGDIEVTTIYDGLWEKPHDPGFIKNASVDETKAALKKAGLTDTYVPIPFTVTIAKIKGKYVMFDSGTGGQAVAAGQGSAGNLAANMKAAGIDAKNIKTIIVTHFHPDHIFGLMEKGTNAAVYPNAEIIMPAKEYAFWTDPALIPKLPEARQGLAKRIQAVFPTWKNIKQVEADKEVYPGIRSVAAYGHTPGHTAYQMASGNKQLLVLSDITNIPALFARNPDWQAFFDSDGNMAVETRKRLFARAVAEKATITGYHYGMPGAGTIAKDGNGYAYVPVKA